MIEMRAARALVLRAGMAAALAVLLLAGAPGRPLAGTTGKIAGSVADPEARPVAFATVEVLGAGLGAASDVAGRVNIIGVPSGVYSVRVTMIGYATVVVKDVVVSADQTTRLDIELPETDVLLETVEVSAKRPVVEVNLTSSMSSLTREEIEALPVQELQDVVNLQAGVVDGHFRGGRIGEVQFQVDGVSVNNAYDNKVSLRLDRSLLEEVQVISGTFDAEYGQAMSGVVNAVLKSGTPEFRWDGEVFYGGHVFPGGEDRRLTDDSIDPAALQNYQLTLRGPTGIPETVFLLSGRRYLFDDYVSSTRIFVPTDSSDFERKIYYPTGDGEEIPLEYSREWSGAAKITSRFGPKLSLGYQGIYNDIQGRRDNYAYRYNPDGLTKQHTTAVTHGLDLKHTISTSTFYSLSFRQNYFDYEDLLYDDVFDPRYDAAGPPISDDNYEPGAIIQGADYTRFRQRTTTYLAKGSLLSQVSERHLVKVGGEYQLPRIRFGTPGHLVATVEDGIPTLVRHIDEPPDYPGVVEYRPVVAAAFAQDQVEWNDLTLRAGFRLDYFDARSTIPSDLANPANSIEGAPESVPVETSRKYSVAPRLGVAYPITDRAAVHFAYGHFYQYPAIGEIFKNADYSVLNDLQAGGADYEVLGNPDIKPERTIQYEFGYKHAVTDHIGIDLTLFYKDIRDLLGVEFVSTYNAAEYARLTNIDYGSVVGFTLALDQRRIGVLQSSLDYTWQLAQGNASDPRETATRAEAGLDDRPRQVPFNWDQRHTLNLSFDLNRQDDFALSTVVRLASGQPYTPVLESGFGYGLEANSGRKPASLLIDVRGEKEVRGGKGVRMSLFGRVFNLLDTRYSNGFVFADTGSPYYTRFPEQTTLYDPTRFYAARRIELGLRFEPSG